MKTDTRDPRTLLRKRSTVRNWDYTKPISKSKIDYIRQCIQLTPTCNNECYYTVLFVTNKTIIQQLYHDVTYCYEGDNRQEGDNKVAMPIPEQDLGNPMVKRLNGQVNAPLLLAFASVVNQEEINYGIGMEQCMFCGGITMLAAEAKGLDTGCCNCFDVQKANDVLGITGEYSLQLLMGIGYKDGWDLKNKPKLIHDAGQHPAYQWGNNLPGASIDEPNDLWDNLIQSRD